MLEPPVPFDEADRIEVLRSCNVLDTEPEPELDEIARIAAQACNAPMALITLVDSERQWFKARVGVALPETVRRVSFCAHALMVEELLVIPDTLEDARFVDNPFVTGDPHVRFYAGAPIKVTAGSALGTLCVFDRVPRTLTPQQVSLLEGLARRVARELALRSELLRVRRSLAALPRKLAPGDRVGSHTIVREIGAGGVGSVFEAHTETGERIAIKVLLPGWGIVNEVVERFAREARILAQLDSPHVTRIVDVGNLSVDHGELPYIAMEFLEGTDLHTILEREGHVDPSRAVRWIREACEGLAQVHARGIVHRDLKPANLFLTKEGTLKVLDFGVAKIATAFDPLTRTGAVIGSLRYMAPEQMLGMEVDPRSDVWSLGAVLYELVTGKRPFKGENEIQICVEIMQGQWEHLSDASLDPIVARCLARLPEDRYENAGELRDALDQK